MKRSILGGCLALLLGVAVTTAVGIGVSYGMEQAPQVPQVHLRKPLSALAADAQAATPEVAASAPATPESTASAAAGYAVVGPDPGEGYVRLPGHVLDVLTKAVPDLAGQSNSRISLTVVLRRDNQAGFDRYVHDLYDPLSPNFRHFLTQEQIANRFGPSRRDYAQVSAYLQGRGLKLVQRSKNRMTLAVSGTRAQVEKAFSAKVTDFKMGETHFFANQNDPTLPIRIAGHVQAVIGLNSVARPQSVIQPTLTNLKNCSLNTNYTQDLQIECAVTYGLDLALYDILCMLSNLFLGKTMPFLNSAAGVVGTTLGGIPTGNGQFFTLCSFQLPYQNPISLYPSGSSASASKKEDALSVKLHSAAHPSAAQPEGQGQKIGLVEFDSFNTSDVSDLLAYLGMPASTISQLNVVKLPGSPPIGAGEDEVLLDIGVTLTNAPSATTTVYEAPFTGVGSFQSVFNRMIDDGMTVISNSWAYCEDQTTLADVQSIDSILQSAAAAGISVFSGAGDTGNTCLDGSKGVIAVPADSPNITAVGGTTANLGMNYYGSETWWDGSASVPTTGQGGFGTSKFFARPSYQDGFTNSTQRSIPDVASAADPAVNGLPLCKADQGGCPNGLSYGGTSASTPFWASLTALFNAVGGKNIGLVNPVYYNRAQTAGFQGFHTAASMGSDFSHVGLGSPNGSFLFMSLTGVAVGPAVAAISGFAGKPAELPADGTSTANLIVELADANSASVSGKTVTLAASAGSHAVISSATAVTSTATGTANFTVTDATAETVTFTATDTTDGFALPQPVTIVFDVPPPASAGITANPGTVTADGQSAATVTVTLKDSLNRPVPGKTVSVSDNGSHAVLTGPTPGVTDMNGQISFSATDQVNETVTFSAVDVTDGNLVLPGSASVIYSSATSTACSVNVVPVASAGYTITPFVTGLPAAPTISMAAPTSAVPVPTTPPSPPQPRYWYRTS
jgi:subtilase family serine protease